MTRINRVRKASAEIRRGRVHTGRREALSAVIDSKARPLSVPLISNHKSRLHGAVLTSFAGIFGRQIPLRYHSSSPAEHQSP